MKVIRFYIVALFFLGCNSCQTDIDRIKEAIGGVTEQDLLPYYKEVYTVDSIEIENIQELLNKDTLSQEDAMMILINSCPALKADFYNYSIDKYKKVGYYETTNSYSDVGNIARFIVWKYQFKQTECFGELFSQIELILMKGDEMTTEVIIVGLFESIQNISGWHNIDYYEGFDKWLKPKSKEGWDELIKYWEE